MVAGAANADIARQLGLSGKTVGSRTNVSPGRRHAMAMAAPRLASPKMAWMVAREG
jgi:hypothetical protein